MDFRRPFRVTAICSLLVGFLFPRQGQTEDKDKTVTHQLVATVKDMGQDKQVRRAALYQLEAGGGRGQPWFKDLLLSLLGPQERNPRMAQTAIQMLLQGWGSGKDSTLKHHLLAVAADTKRWDELRTASIEALCGVWNEDEELKQALLLLAAPGEPDEKVRGSAMAALAQIWSGKDWLKQALLQWASPGETVRMARVHAILALGRAWPHEPSLKALLLTYATSEAEHWEVRSASMEALGRAWGGQDWLKELLLPFTAPALKNQDQRFFALYAVAEFFGPQPWVKDLLLPVAASTHEDEYGRWQCTKDIARLWGRAEWVQELLVAQAHRPEGEFLVRHTALGLLLDLWAKEQTADREFGRDPAKIKGKAADDLPWLKTLLLRLSAPDEKDPSIRMESLWALCNIWEREPWLKAMLLPLAAAEEKDESIRAMAVAQLEKF